MQYFKNFIKLSTISLVIASSAYAIDIEPEHDAILETPKSKPIETKIDYKKSPVQYRNSLPVLPSRIVTKITPKDNLPKIAPQSLSEIAPQIKHQSSVMPTTNEQRIYYARSVSSNNPEYKTRFSILHNTPSPKRIAGERLYNVSDNFFRLTVKGNKIEILDNPVFNLIGINSATGRYGEIKFLDGAVLDVQGTSKNFKGNWDVDGTGEKNLKITPTNLISGIIPVHIKTYKADGTVVTDETHDLTFKALAMGPYNGYWSDGADIGIFLWGMSSLKLKSKEMAYLGLDLGIVTQNAPENTGTTTHDNTDTAELLPGIIAPAPFDNNATSSIQPFGGNGYSSAPFFGNFGGGFGGGFIGGGGGGGGDGDGGGGGGNTTIIDNNGCLVINNVINSIGSNNTNIINNNVNNTNTNTNSNSNTNNVTIINNNGNKEIKCVVIVDNDTLCKQNPNLPECKNPNDCKINPSAPGCKNPDFCELNPNHPICKKPEDCKTNPLAQGCENYCTANPKTPECCALNPSKCDPVDICIQNPNLPQCKPDPDPETPVSEPFAPLVFLASIMAYLGIKRRKNS